MTTTKFEDLSNELILSTFEYLSVADRYNAFFNTNTRLQSLVKRWTEFSREDLYHDIHRFCTLHSWYKHLTFDNGGTLYLLYPRRGEQPRYSFDLRVTDPDGLHWGFSYGPDAPVSLIKDERVRDILARHPVRLNPFFHGSVPRDRKKGFENSQGSGHYFHGSDLILRIYRPTVEEWLKKEYPDCAQKLLSQEEDYTIMRDRPDKFAPVFKGEGQKAVTAIMKAAEEIWKELKELNDLNVMKIFSPEE